MARRKILVDIFYLHVAQTGIKTYIECLCEEIEKSNSAEFEFIVSPSRRSIKSSTFFKGKTAFWKNLLYQLIYFYRKLVVVPWLSIYHGASIVFSPDILSPLCARGTKVSVIHDAFFWENPSHYNRMWLKVFLGFLKASLKSDAHVITVSAHSKIQLQKHLQLPGVPVHVVYPSSTIRPKVRRESVNPLGSPYFLHVGVMEKRKNLLTLIHAFSDLIKHRAFQSLKLVLVGQRGPRKTLDDYENILRLIEDLDLRGKVILPGFVDSKELENYYRNALAYVFPSLNEGFGMPILEAFSYGLPVIISNQGTLAEVGGDAVLKVEENTAKGFEAALRTVASDELLRKTMAEKGQARLRQFSPTDFFLSLQDCFRRILNE